MMQMVNRKSIPGWFLLVFGPCWQFLGVWARIEFVFKKLWPEKSIIPTLTAIASSPWFSVALVLGGLLWIWWSKRPIIHQTAEWIPLKEACQKLYDESKIGVRTTKFMQGLIERSPQSGGHDEELNLLGEFFVQKIPIYGKRSPFANLERIDKAEFNKSEIKKGASSLYYFGDYGIRGAKFVDLTVKKREVPKAIKEILFLWEGQFD